MKTIKGVTFDELDSKVIWGIEIEPEFGGRHWEYGTEAEIKDIRQRASDAGELSDVDLVVIEKQPEEIQDCLVELERLYREHKCELNWVELFEKYGEDELGHKLPTDNILKLIKAGNATITLHSGITGVHYTYQIKKHAHKYMWFVSLMTGTNNDNDYSYMAHFWNDNIMHQTSKSCVAIDSKPALAFQYFMKHINRIPDALGVYHAGKCCRCGRTLTTPESIQLGVGPECAKLLGV